MLQLEQRNQCLYGLLQLEKYTGRHNWTGSGTMRSRFPVYCQMHGWYSSFVYHYLNGLRQNTFNNFQSWIIIFGPVFFLFGTDGTNHVPCCIEEGVPDICQDICRGEYAIPTDDIRTHVSCSAYTEKTLACIAEGIGNLLNELHS